MACFEKYAMIGDVEISDTTSITVSTNSGMFSHTVTIPVSWWANPGILLGYVIGKFNNATGETVVPWLVVDGQDAGKLKLTGYTNDITLSGMDIQLQEALGIRGSTKTSILSYFICDEPVSPAFFPTWPMAEFTVGSETSFGYSALGHDGTKASVVGTHRNKYLIAMHIDRVDGSFDEYAAFNNLVKQRWAVGRSCSLVMRLGETGEIALSTSTFDIDTDFIPLYLVDAQAVDYVKRVIEHRDVISTLGPIAFSGRPVAVDGEKVYVMYE